MPMGFIWYITFIQHQSGFSKSCSEDSYCVWSLTVESRIKYNRPRAIEKSFTPSQGKCKTWNPEPEVHGLVFDNMTSFLKAVPRELHGLSGLSKAMWQRAFKANFKFGKGVWTFSHREVESPQYVFHWSLYLEVRNNRLLRAFITKCHNQRKRLVLCQSLNRVHHWPKIIFMRVQSLGKSEYP